MIVRYRYLPELQHLHRRLLHHLHSRASWINDRQIFHLRRRVHFYELMQSDRRQTFRLRHLHQIRKQH